MEQITINAEFLFELQNKQEWINRVPACLPLKTRGGERLVWVDKHGNVYESGADFKASEEQETYPCKVYRPVSVSTNKAPETLQIITSKLIREPQTKEDVLHNVAHRIDNVNAWLKIDEYECALVIAKGLVKDLERALVAHNETAKPSQL